MEIKTTIIVPAYNEQEGLPITIDNLLKLRLPNSEIVVVDDGSTDKTLDIAHRYPVVVVGHRVNMGKGMALRTGTQVANGENVIWIDADSTYPVDVIPQMVDEMNNGNDAVVCSRVYGRGNIPRFNRLGLWLFGVLIRGIYGFKPFDPCTGLYGVKRECLQEMGLVSRRFAIEPEISMKGARMGLKMLEIPIEYNKRVGSSKLNAVKVGFEDLVMIARLVFWKPKEDKRK